MKLLTILLNATATSEYLKNPLYEPVTFHSIFNDVTTVLYSIGIIFIIAMTVFSLLKFSFFVTPEKKIAARNQLIFFVGLFAILLIQTGIEKIAITFTEPAIARIIGACSASMLLLVFYKVFLVKVQITSIFKLHD